MDQKDEQAQNDAPSDAPTQPEEKPVEQAQPESTDSSAEAQPAADALEQPVEQPAAQETPQEAQPEAPVEASQQTTEQPFEGPDSSSLEAPSDTQVQSEAEQPAAASSQSGDVQKNMGVFGHAHMASGKQKMMKKVGAIVAVVVMVAVLGLIAQSLFFGGSRIGSLVSDTQDGITFMRPEGWVMATTDDDFTYYTEEGVEIGEVDLGLLLGSETFGVRYDSLSDTEKETIKSSFETQFGSIDTSLTDGSCTELAGVNTTETQREGYDLAFSIEATCSKLKDKETGGTVKIILGWHDTELHIFGVVADDATWESDGEKLDEVVASAMPAE